MIAKIDSSYGCYCVWDENNTLIATYYRQDGYWLIDFGDEHLFAVASEAKAIEWISKARTTKKVA